MMLVYVGLDLGDNTEQVANYFGPRLHLKQETVRRILMDAEATALASHCNTEAVVMELALEPEGSARKLRIELIAASMYRRESWCLLILLKLCHPPQHRRPIIFTGDHGSQRPPTDLNPFCCLLMQFYVHGICTIACRMLHRHPVRVQAHDIDSAYSTFNQPAKAKTE
jgi:hypothetical protein